MDRGLIDIHTELGILASHLKNCKLKLQAEPKLSDLKVAAIDFEGKPFLLETKAHKAFQRMRLAALKDKVILMPFSGFRSYLYQRNLIANHLKNGRTIDDILTAIAIPGFSEHHTGRAIDFHELGKNSLEEDFEKTASFEWLSQNAGRFHFTMSYPRDNKQGIIYEPWHWFFSPQETSSKRSPRALRVKTK